MRPIFGIFLFVVILIAAALDAGAAQSSVSADLTGTLTITRDDQNVFHGTAAGTGTVSGLGSAGISGTTAVPAEACLGTPPVDSLMAFTLDFSAGNTLTGTVVLPCSVLVAALLGGSGSGSGPATVTGGTGLYAGATGSFPSLTITLTVTGQTASQINGNFHMSGPGTLSLPSNQVSVSFSTSPAGLAITVDGSTYTTPKTIQWTAGSQHTVSVPSPQTAGGVSRSFAVWSDGSRDNPRTLAAPSSDSSYVASFSDTTSVSRLIPVTPCRIADTRNATGAFGGPVMSAGSSRTFAIPQSACGIPSTAMGYSLNVTVVPRSALGYLTLWPTGQSRPLVSTLNSPAGKIVANAALVPSGTNGSVDVYVTDTTDVILDINGYFAPPGDNGLAFYAVTPCRISDTRNANGSFGGPKMSAGSTRSIPVPASACGIPSTAKAYSLNATVVPSGGLGYLSLWPTGQSQPFVSTLNSPDGSIVANAAIVPAGTNGAISAYVTDATDLILDINGYFANPGGSNALSFYAATPCRIADTRNATGAFGGPVMEAGSSRSFLVTNSSCSIPATAKAFSLNATVVPSGSLGYLSLWPTGGVQPLVSTLNSPRGLIVANAAIVPAGTNGGVDAYVTDRTQLILDINGYFAP